MHMDDDPGRCWEANAETWTRQSRAGYDIYRDAINTPAFLEMLPPVNGLNGLDVGCGEGTNTRNLARRGAAMQAVDIAPTFILRASEVEAADPLGIAYRVGDARQLPFPEAAFDFVTAFMCLMDVRDPGTALREIARILRPGGFVQFSILHPCFAPPRRRVLRDAEGNAYAIEVADYFAVGPHVETWHFSRMPEEEKRTVPPFRVPYVHLTLAGWMDAVIGAGLVLRRFGEPMASEETAATVPEVADTRVAPLFLHVLADKKDGRGA
jgi:2-polyprenyl-3-methyl-5-hydroxy-6-metoxy-1,4-benzoquinol methylase